MNVVEAHDASLLGVAASDMLVGGLSAGTFRLIFNTLTALSAIAYYKGITTEPGFVDENAEEFAKWRNELHAYRNARERKKTVLHQNQKSI